MQPENIIATAPDKPEPVNGALPHPLEQWDRLCIQAIHETLAPKGFMTIKIGAFQGHQVVKHDRPMPPGVSNNDVALAAKVTAQCVRSFRSKAVHLLSEDIKKRRALIEEDVRKLGRTSFWQFKERRELIELIAFNTAAMKTKINVVSDLNLMPVKG